MKPPVVAIDGPAASGKSTTARLAAERLGFVYLDTGAMYRAITWKVLDEGIAPDDEAAIGELADRVELEVRHARGGSAVLVDGRDVTGHLREPRISRAVSAVALVPRVRRALVRIQRELAREGGVVVEGRDIGTVVFPDAAVKIYLEASLRARAERRLRELRQAGVRQTLPELEAEIAARDRQDAGRSDSPLRRAPDALLLDTTGLDVAQQVEAVVAAVERAMRGPEA